MNINNLRLDYNKSSIDFNNTVKEPKEYFITWFNQAIKMNIKDPNACVLSTISQDNKPSSRVILLKEINSNGFIFFTNYNSNKSKDIKHNNNVSLNFYWPDLEKQIRIVGTTKRISRKESEEYFQNRPKKSQIGAIISNQSEEVKLNFDFDKELQLANKKFKNKIIQCPENWGGYCVIPLKYEFWQGRPSRLHDRITYVLEHDKWMIKRLAP
tara:strand:- start:402 stop:1037 length:636 start_codon:yes stop_codon:yes gene_type:complete